MTKGFIVSAVLFIFSTSISADCTLEIGMTKNAVVSKLGSPDWMQSPHRDAWAYFNSGIEVIFQKDRLYAVRFEPGTPSLPRRLSRAGVKIGQTLSEPVSLGEVRDDSSDGPWRSRMYSDGETFAAMLNYNKESLRLSNVLLKQASFTVDCDPEATISSEDFPTWFQIGATIGRYIEYRTLRLSQVDRLIDEVANTAPLLARAQVREAFGSVATAELPGAAMLLRDRLLAIASAHGRKTRSRALPAAVFTGMYAATIGSDLAPVRMNHEPLNHFEGMDRHFWDRVDAGLSKVISELVLALRRNDYDEAQRISKLLMKRFGAV